MNLSLTRLTIAVLGFSLAALAHAQSPRTRLVSESVNQPGQWSPPGGQDFGLANLTYVRVTGQQFTTFDGTAYAVGNGISRYPLTSEAMEAGVYVPSGAIIEYLEIDYWDSNANTGVGLSLSDCGALGQSCSQTIGFVVSQGNSGFGKTTMSGLNYPVSNTTNSLNLEMTVGAHDGTVSLTSAIVGYRLRVSPAPATPTFTDVLPNNIYFPFIEALAASGITSGCQQAPLLYCPDRPITRAEMAVFLVTALGLHFPN